MTRKEKEGRGRTSKENSGRARKSKDEAKDVKVKREQENLGNKENKGIWKCG